MVGELLDGGGELLVVAGEFTDPLYQALDGVIFFRGLHCQGVKGLSEFFFISSQTCCSMFLSATTALAVRPALPVVNLFSSSTSLVAARNYFFAGAHLRSIAAFFFRARYLVLMRPVAPRCVCTCMTISASLMGILPSAASLWHSSCFLKYMSIGRLRSGGSSYSFLFLMRRVSSIFA